MGYCKICFSEINKKGINGILFKNTICQNCYNKFPVSFNKRFINEIEVISIYEYDETMKKLIYQYKGCFDIELGSVFLERHLLELKIKYKGYVIVPVPSWEESNQKRGFNHIVEIFKFIGIPIFPCIKKKYDFKQSNLSKIEREKINQKLVLEDYKILKNKKVLLVDDVISTGSSIKACLELIKKGNPKRIKCLVICGNCRNM
ncbi:MAG: ComF family protein [Erysipelotrichaceae bacterium]|nr:ComF family protein [Erysipelotrichaceae bacterium]